MITMAAMTDARALLLNANFQPLKVITWERAVLLLLDEKADLVTEYVGRLVRSVSLSMPLPAVVRLRKFAQIKGRVRFNRQNVLARDAYTCSYCDCQPRNRKGPDLEALTLDHVIPRAQSRGGTVLMDGVRVAVTCWTNVTTACCGCNVRKADRTPAQAGMRLLRLPRVPTPLDVLRMSLVRVKIPDEWRDYLPADSEWRDYWTAELNSE